MKKNTRKFVKFWTLMTLALPLVSLNATAQIYKSVDENGVVTFSDTPPKPSANAQTTIVNPGTTNSIPGVEIPSDAAAPQASDPVSTQTLSISSPSDNATIPMGAGIFDVIAELGAPLGDGELLALYLDGEMVDIPQSGNVWTLNYVTRGPHTLQVHRLARDGESVNASEMITVFVLRPSILRASPR